MIFRVIGLLVVATMVLIGIGYVLMPDFATFQRTITIAAPPEAVFERVNGMRRVQEWSPWRTQDPDMVVEYSGPEVGSGSRMTWTSKQHGVGSQEIKEATFAKSVLYKIQWGADTVSSVITITPQDDNTTKVLWTYRNELGNNPFKRLMGPFYPASFAPAYEQGLLQLKSQAESGAPIVASVPKELDTAGLPSAVEKALTDKEPQPTSLATTAGISLDPEIAVIEARPIVFVSTKAKSNDQADISRALGDANNAVIEYMQKHSLDVSGHPLAISSQHDPEGERQFDAAFPLVNVPAGLPEDGRVKLGTLPAGKVMMMQHKGAYSSIDETYKKLHAKIKEKGLKEGKFFWEEYVTDASEVDETELLTNVFIQVE